MTEIKPFFEKPLTDEELDMAVEAPLDASIDTTNQQDALKWKQEATNAVALQRLITEIVDKISELENRETFVREQGEEKTGEHAGIVDELKRLQYQLETAQVLEQNILHRLESTGKTIDDANYESATIAENEIEQAKNELLDAIADIVQENDARNAAREAIVRAA